MELNKEKLQELLLIVENQLISEPWIRFGQSFWNNLVTNYPTFGNLKITQYDCFYNDNRVNLLINKICDKETIEYWDSLHKDLPPMEIFKYDSTYIDGWAKNNGYL